VDLTQADPNFYDDGEEFQDVDVEGMWVDGLFVVIMPVVPNHVFWNACLPEIID
jgi:hypothetical protein